MDLEDLYKYFMSKMSKNNILDLPMQVMGMRARHNVQKVEKFQYFFILPPFKLSLFLLILLKAMR